MNPKLNGFQLPRWVLLGTIGLFVTLSATAITLTTNAEQPTHKSGDLLTLVHDLSGTTNEMLANTKSLQQQVNRVQEKLGQLNTQEAILQKQTATGENLLKELSTQEQLTARGVGLMEEILKREHVSVDATAKVQNQVSQLTKDVAANAGNLQRISGSLDATVQESRTLNGQMDQLLAELQKSQDSFKLFGTLKSLLSNPSSLLNIPGNVLNSLQSAGQSGGQSPVNNLLPPAGQSSNQSPVNNLLPPAGQPGTLLPPPSAGTDPIGSLLNGGLIP